MTTPNDNEPKTDTENTESVAGAGCPASPCSPSFAEIMFHLERLIHQHDDSRTEEGYHPDSLWLEEVRHHIGRLQRDVTQARKAAKKWRDKWLDGADPKINRCKLPWENSPLEPPAAFDPNEQHNQPKP